MQGYDNWLWNQASYLDDYWYDFCPWSEPMLMKNDTYNCEICENSDCEHWAEYHGYKEEKERILDSDWVEFFNATCERYKNAR